MNKVSNLGKVTWISASAGTGKTHYIMTQILDLLLSGVHPSSILCLAFTRTAALEMERRIYKQMQTVRQQESAVRGGNLDTILTQFFAHPVRCCTIHCLAKQFCNQDTILNAHTSTQLLDQALEITVQKWHPKPLPLEIHRIRDTIEYTTRTTEKLSNQYTATRPTPVNLTEIYTLKPNNSTVKLKALHNAIQNNDLDACIDIVLNKDGSIRKTLISKAFAVASPGAAQEVEKLALELQQYSIDLQNYHAMSASHTLTEFVRHTMEAYNRLKAQSQGLDFSDLLTKGYTALKHDEKAFECIGKLTHLFVDESQDLSEKQWRLISKISTELWSFKQCSIYIVGDPKQSIYQFYGASSDLYYKTKKEYQQLAKRLKLEWIENSLDVSYRSGQGILNYVDRIMSTCGLCCTHTSHDTDKKSTVQFVETNEANTSNGMVQTCITLLDQLIHQTLLNTNRPIQYSDIMILIKKRTPTHFALVHELNLRHIPVKSNPFLLRHDPLITDLVNVAKLVDDKSQDYLLGCLLKGPYFKWSDTDLIQSSRPLFNQLDTQIPHHKRVVDAFKRWDILPRNPCTFYGQLLFHDSFGTKLMQTHYYHTLRHFWELVIESQTYTLSSFINWFEATEEVSTTLTDGVEINTIHSTKGREAPVVILPDMCAKDTNHVVEPIIDKGTILHPNSHPHYDRLKAQHNHLQTQQAHNLLYVAMTRAQEQLYVLGDKGKHNTLYPILKSLLDS